MRMEPGRVRGFCQAPCDLEIAFDDADPAATVTALLMACIADDHGQPVGADDAWDWSMNRRLHGLIAVRLATDGAPLELQGVCERCREALAIELDLRALDGDVAVSRFQLRVGAGEMTLRLPTGRDLQRWRRYGTTTPEALVASLIEAPAGEAPVLEAIADPACLAALDDALEAHDPLTAFHLQVCCPSCDHKNAMPCDLEALLLNGFARTRAALLDEVLRIALALHWSEAAILALPAWRRRHYLRRLSAGG